MISGNCREMAAKSEEAPGMEAEAAVADAAQACASICRCCVLAAKFLPLGLGRTRNRCDAQFPPGISPGSSLSFCDARPNPSGSRVSCTADAAARYCIVCHSRPINGPNTAQEKNHSNSLTAVLVKKMGKKMKLRMERSRDFFPV